MILLCCRILTFWLISFLCFFSQFLCSGDMNMISLNDMFGFECLPRNHIEQLMINSLNEQLQYLYNQRMFAWELLELEEEQIPHSTYKYHNNKNTVDHLMSKPYGLFFFLDDCTRDRMKYEFITGMCECRNQQHFDDLCFFCFFRFYDEWLLLKLCFISFHTRYDQYKEKCVCAESKCTWVQRGSLYWQSHLWRSQHGW